VDDAAGEAFDKVAAILELGYPGGPLIDALAREGDPAAIGFPRPWIHKPHFDFSFSGLKTAVLYHTYGGPHKYGSVAHFSRRQLADIAASFQAALVDTLVAKTLAAAQHAGVSRVVVGGGVAANSGLRAALKQACSKRGLDLHLTPLQYCTDNAAMVAALGYHRLQAGHLAGLNLEPRAGLQRPQKKSSQ
jgi:N6-L-threonylcarbamoyladenine synthase